VALKPNLNQPKTQSIHHPIKKNKTVMTLKLYVQPFVIPYLESQGLSRNLDRHQGNNYTQKINDTLIFIQQFNTQICRKMPINRYDFQPYTSSIEISVDENILPKKTYQNIVAQSYLTIQFSKHIRQQLCDEFMQLMQNHHQPRSPNRFSMSKVIGLFYDNFNLDEDLFSSQILRKYYERNKNK
jgi:hypothetical protein